MVSGLGRYRFLVDENVGQKIPFFGHMMFPCDVSSLATEFVGASCFAGMRLVLCRETARKRSRSKTEQGEVDEWKL